MHGAVEEDVGHAQVNGDWLIEVAELRAHSGIFQRRDALGGGKLLEVAPTGRVAERGSVIQGKQAAHAARGGLWSQPGTVGVFFLGEFNHPPIQIRTAIAVQQTEGDVYLVFSRNLAHPRDLGASFQDERRAGGRPLVDDPWRATAEFIIGTDGRVRLSHLYQYCEDFPEPLVLTAAAQLAENPMLPGA